MYRLILYILIVYLIIALILSFLGVLAFSPQALVFSTLFLLAICWLTNKIFAYFFEANANVESNLITALILALIITPPSAILDASYFSLAIWASLLAIASKFILAIKSKHVFNPAALGVALTALTIGQSASWWVGTRSMLIFVLLGGLLLVRKIRRFDLMVSFLIVALVVIVFYATGRGTGVWEALQRTILDTPIIFFSTIMLTEPLTAPPTLSFRIFYGILVGLLFAPQIHFEQFYSTPEIALLIGNIYAYLVSPKQKLDLRLDERLPIANQIYDFVFRTDKKLAFAPGQYLEWTVAPKDSDDRGNRRYFTIASSPTEDKIRIGVKTHDRPSTFKQKLMGLEPGERIFAAQLAGDFILPKDPNQKLVFMAGGIGITPFRSMLKYLIDKNEKRPIVLFYSNKTVADIAYAEILKQAERQLQIKLIFALTDVKFIPKNWTGVKGQIDGRIIAKEVPDFKERVFYLSGPHGMVEAFDDTLKSLGVSRTKIKKDFFPGFV